MNSLYIIQHILIVTSILLCLGPSSATAYYEPSEEIDAQIKHATTPLHLLGTVTDRNQIPLSDVLVFLGDSSTTTNGNGEFNFFNLDRKNALLYVEKVGYYSWCLPVHLFHKVNNENGDTLSLPPVILDHNTSSSVRFLFGGDVSFGRRFLSPIGTGELTDPYRYMLPPDNPDAIIQISNPLEGMNYITRNVKPLFDCVDYPIINFESPLTDYPSTSHPTKSYAFYSLPQSLDALKSLNIEYVTIGNNHIYDYMHEGLMETIFHLQNYGMLYSGAGENVTAAFMPCRKQIKNHPYSFFSSTAVLGTQYNIPWGATDSSSGVANLNTISTAQATIQNEITNGFIPIVFLHHGKEYSEIPSTMTCQRNDAIRDANPSLIVCHHTHTPQGFSYEDSILIIECLGNFIFDQPQLETSLSILAVVDMDGSNFKRALAVPIFQSGFCPLFLCGDPANYFTRWLCTISAPSVTVFPYNSNMMIATSSSEYTVDSRSIAIPVTIPPDNFAIVDLRNYLHSDESFSNLSIDVNDISCHLGRDILWYGGFEDVDTDEETLGECSRWIRTQGTYRGFHNPHRGAAAYYSTGNSQRNPYTLFISTTADSVVMGDNSTTINRDEVGMLDLFQNQFSTFHSDGYYIWEKNQTVRFGSDSMFSALNISTDQNIDAIHVHTDGCVSFSCRQTFSSPDIGDVKDGTIVTYDPDNNTLIILLHEDSLFQNTTGDDAVSNNIDIDGLAIDEITGLIYFSITGEGVLNGLDVDPVFVSKGDIIKLDTNTHSAQIVVHENQLFSDSSGNIDGLSILNSEEFLFSTSSPEVINGNDVTVNLVDGAIGAYNIISQNPRVFIFQSELFENSAHADIDALHAAPNRDSITGDTLTLTPKGQIIFRNTIRLENYSNAHPNKNIGILGYTRLENNGPLTFDIEYLATRKGKSFGHQMIFNHPGEGNTDWIPFYSDCMVPDDDPDAVDVFLDNPWAFKIRIFHDRRSNGSRGLVGFDDIAVITWKSHLVNENETTVLIPDEFNLFEGIEFTKPHCYDFVKLFGPPGTYTLTATAIRYKPF